MTSIDYNKIINSDEGYISEIRDYAKSVLADEFELAPHHRQSFQKVSGGEAAARDLVEVLEVKEKIEKGEYALEEELKNYRKVSAILGATSDGDDLSSSHLYLLQLCMNDNVNRAGLDELDRVYDMIFNGDGYERPYYLGVEHMTRDTEGFVYYKGKEVEHYSYQDPERAKKALVKLQKRCIWLEENKIPISSGTAVWSWEQQTGPNKPE